MEHYIFEKPNSLDHGQVNNGSQIHQVEHLHKALPGDKVEYDVESKSITRIVERSSNFIPGILLCNGPVMGIIRKGPTSSVLKRKFIPDDRSFPTFIVTCRKKNGPNEYGIIKFKEWESEYPIGEFINKVGNGIPGDLETEKLFHRYSHGIMRKKYSKRLDMSPYDIDLTPERKTLDECIISIDPSGCYDIDDALHINQIDDDKYEVGIHISDVSSYIPIGSELDKEASERCESLYLDWEQVDMFPNDIVKEASLFEKIPRRAFTVIVKIKTDGTILKTQFFKSNIIVARNLSYLKAQTMVDTEQKGDVPESVQMLYRLGNDLYDSKKIVDSSQKYDIHTTVSVFMVLCNSIVAKEIERVGLYQPICRAHEGFPEIEIDSVDSYIRDKIVQFNTQAAVYVLGKSPHKALGQSLYSHFTSPLRRYIDILSHRLLYNSITGCNDPVSHKDLIEDIYTVNKMHSNIQKANRRSKILVKAHDMYEKDDTVVDTYGYIIGIEDTQALVHVPDHSTDVYCQIYSHRIKHLITVINHGNRIEFDHVNNKNRLELTLGQRVDLKMVIAFREDKYMKKMFGQLTNPNPIDLFKFSLFDDE